MTEAREAHWDEAYRRAGPSGVGWFQPTPTVSLELIDELGLGSDAPIIDIGGGTSSLVDALIDRGFDDLSVLDVSQVALDLARDRLGGGAADVCWLHTDVLDFRPTRHYALWHDRAVFHFLVDPSERERYLDALRAGLADDGVVIMGTFAPDAPERCSGLPVQRYGPHELAAALGASRIVASRRQEHVTPGGTRQPFTWVVAAYGDTVGT